MPVTFRDALPFDDAFLYKLYASTRAEEMEMTGWDTVQRESFLRMQFDAQRMHYAEHYSRADHRIILVDGKPAGRVMVERKGDAIVGVDIALMPEHRSSGIGSAIIKDLLKEAEQAGKPFKIQVEKLNRALRLYMRLGFTLTGETATHYQMEWKSKTKG